MIQYEYFLKYLGHDPENKTVIQELANMLREHPGSLPADIVSSVKKITGADDGD